MGSFTPHQPNLFKPDSRVLVVGLGKSGFAAVKFFTSRHMKVSVSDATPVEGINPEYISWLARNRIHLESGGHSPELFTTADCIVVSPGIPLDLEPLQAARRQSIPIVGELAFAGRFLRTPVVAVTGTNGKTTVTTLLGNIFQDCGKKVFVGGNIGTPLLDYINGPQDADIAILEISSFQLDSGGGADGLRPAAALLLNITPDHLDRYDSLEAYAASKFKIFAAQQPGDVAILNTDDEQTMRHRDWWPASRRFFFGRPLHGLPGASLQGRHIVLSAEVSPQERQELYDLSNSDLREQPNLDNSMAAILAARLMGCQPDGIMAAIERFSPLPHRMTLVAELNGVRYIDDSKATNIGALQAALTAMPGNVVLIAGGRDKGGDYAMLTDVIRKKVKMLLLIGEAKEKMAASFRMLTKLEMADSLEEAVYLASNDARPGDIVLLSPACASFDMFSSYTERGETFKRAVLALTEKTEHRRTAGN
jgi:UDP-N-acetylmuramoylalanine--D-glutamate ligase